MDTAERRLGRDRARDRRGWRLFAPHREQARTDFNDARTLYRQAGDMPTRPDGPTVAICFKLSDTGYTKISTSEPVSNDAQSRL
jgi:hypothetical protein